ncbi:MAG: nitroreductase family protein [Dehalococcoidia bacterium]|nr:nitroreductase family protein [Dehalococcoidia bacterium]
MQQIDPRWYSAIGFRRSRRSYQKNRPLENIMKEQLQTVCEEFRPYNTARVEFIAEPPDDIFANALGFYGNIKNAPSFLAFIGDTSDPNLQEKMGYTGEGIILEATALGLGTCWVALTYNAKSVLSIIKLAATEKMLSVSPVGYTVEQWSFQEKMFTGFGAMHQRKPLSSMVTGMLDLQRPEWARAAVEAARLAPSATNRQPWTFNIQNNSVTIAVKDTGMEFNVSKRLDCGIAMLHIELGALSCGVHGKWEYLKKPHVARFTIN